MAQAVKITDHSLPIKVTPRTSQRQGISHRISSKCRICLFFRSKVVDLVQISIKHPN